MRPSGFQSFHLRTTDVASSANFYSSVLGWVILREGSRVRAVRGDETVAFIEALPDRARSAGAPCHWLGLVGVDDPGSSSDVLATDGGSILSPIGPDGDGCVLRDPGGAVFGIARRDGATGSAAWHELHSPDPEGVWTAYRSWFGWHETGVRDLGGALGSYRSFGWSDPRPDAAAGGIADTRRRPGVHPHWLFYFPVDDLDEAVRTIQTGGGSILADPTPGAWGSRIAVAHDPLDAVFGLAQRDPPHLNGHPTLRHHEGSSGPAS